MVYNKIDLLSNSPRLDILNGIEAVKISCVTKEGIAGLIKKIHERALAHYDSNASSARIQSSRHRGLLQKTLESVQSAKTAYQSGLGNELVAIDLRVALNYLGEIIGLTTPDDVLDNIFSKFCIGK
jgi:tRNA modification GTPase